MKKVVLILCVMFSFISSKAQFYYCNYYYIDSSGGNWAHFSQYLPAIYFNDVTSTKVNWGDGQIENFNYAAGPEQHHYCNNGTYTITVSVWAVGNFNCSVSKTLTFSTPQPIGHLNHTQNSNLVDFHCYSSGASQDYHFTWNFGDGITISSGQNSTQSHAYTANGTYYPYAIHTFLDNNNCGFSTTSYDTVIITSVPPPCISYADYTYNVTRNIVDFVNTSVCTHCLSSSYLWDFSDGSTSNLKNPAHTYNHSGTYYVCLTANGVDSFLNPCTDDKCVPVVITYDYPPCTVTPEFTTNIEGLNVGFVSQSAFAGCMNQAFKWDFGDGSLVSISSNPNYTFPSANIYNVCLTITATDSAQIPYSNNICHKVNLLEEEITVYPNPVTEFLSIISKSNLIDCKLYDVAGKCIQYFNLESKNINEFKFDISSFERGIYFLKIIDDNNKSYFNKIIKQ